MAFLPPPRPDVLKRFYEDVYRHHTTAELDYSVHNIDLSPRLDEINAAARRYLGQVAGYRLHDVSCGFGSIVHFLAGQGVDSSGNDFSETFISAGREQGNERITRASYQEYVAANPSRVDFVYMWHALEHFAEPIEELRVVRSHLKERGVCLVRVPNGRFYPANTGSFYDFDWLHYPMHLQYFTPSSLSAILRRAGLRALEIDCSSIIEAGHALFDALGLDADALPCPDAIARAFERNLLTKELRVICCRDDGPYRSRVADADLATPFARDHERSPPTWFASAFAMTQGTDGLRYAFSKAPPRVDGSMEPSTVDGYDVWRGGSEHCVIAPTWISVGESVPMIEWTAPHEGVARVRVFMDLLRRECAGMKLRIYRDDALLVGQDNVRFGEPLSSDVVLSVTKGTNVKIAFPSAASPNFCTARLGLSIACERLL